jgi:alpha-tubulin suppressor-like RCC1 family protein
MTGPSRHVAHLHCLAVLTFSVFCASARAAPPPEPQELAEKESVEKWRRRNARHVLALYEGQSLAAAQDGSLWVWGQGPGEWVGSWPEIEVAQGTPTRVPGIPRVVSVATANDLWHSPALALLEDGTVLSWGQDNSIGQLGDGTTQNRRTRAPVHGLDHVVAIAASAGFGLAVRADGTVWGWGGNGCGELGDGTTESRSLPVQVVGLTQIVAVAANWGSASYALRADGTVWAWGVISEGQNGQMPQPGVSIQPVPVQVPGLSRVVSLSAGYAHALAVRRDGTVWEWGHDTRGPLGNGGQDPIGPVRQVQGLHGVEAVAAGSPFSMAVKRDGTLWTWGGNHSGGMGTGSDRRLAPSPVALTNVRAISSSPSRMLALRTDGTVWTWGAALYGFATQATPVRVESLDGATKIAAGGSHMLALRTDGTLWAWGANSSGQLGDGTTTTRLTPAPVPNLTGVVDVAAGGNHSLALRSDGTVWAWGINYYGQVGDLTLQNRSTAVQVQGLTDVTAVFAHEGLSLALRSDGSVWWWGSTRPAWRRGDRRPHAPEPVQGLTNIVKLGATNEDVFAVRADGTLWKWTVGVPGEVNPAQQVAGFTDAVDVAGNNFDYFFQNALPGLTFPTLQVLRADGTVWTMGDNFMGERGFPSWALTPPGPTKVPGLTGVVSITASGSHVHAVRADGTAVGWGDNANGLIGDGMPPLHFTPVRVPLPRRLSQE